MSVPNTFASATGSIPLSQLDANFAYYDAGIQLTGSAVTFSGSTTFSTGTANGVAYLNGSKVLTTGSALQFDGSSLGLNVTPSAWGGGNKAYEQIGGSLFSGATGNIYLGNNLYFDGTNWLYKNTAAASYYQQGAGAHIWYQAASGTAGTTVTWTQAMTLNASGNLGLGTTSPSRKLSVSGAGAGVDFTDTTQSTRLRFRSDGTTGFFIESTDSAETAYKALRLNNSFYLDSSGNLGIGTTSPVAGFKTTIAGSSAWVTAGANFTIEPDVSSGANGTDLKASFSAGGNGPIKLWTGGSERLRLDVSGNLGLGVTPSAWGAGEKVFEISGGGHVAFANSVANYTANAYYNGGYLYKTSAAATKYAQFSGYHAWYTAASGTAGAAISFTQAMTLDASGNLLVGATSGSSKLVVGSGAGNVTTPTAIQMDNTYGTAAFDKLKFYLFKGATESYGFGLGALAEVQYWAGSSTTGAHVWYTSQTERARIDSSGNFGIGTTSPENLLQVAARFGVSSGGVTRWGQVITASGRANSGYLTWDTGLVAVGTEGATALRFDTNGTERMRLDSSGSLGIGTSSPAVKLDVQSSAGNVAFFRNSSSTAATSYITVINANNATTGLVMAHINDGTGYFGTQNNAALRFVTNDTERARIDSSGNLLVGTTSQIDSGSICLQKSGAASNGIVIKDTNAGGGNQLKFLNSSGTTVGYINQNGTVTVYSTTSDQRLKENIIDAPEFGSVIDSIKVRSYDWKENGSHQRAGFVAQELVTVAPEAVHQPADPEEMMAVDYSKLVPMLVKEIQSLRARVAQLESK